MRNTVEGNKKSFRLARKTGSLALAARGLEIFPHEICHLDEHMEAVSVFDRISRYMVFMDIYIGRKEVGMRRFDQN